MISTVNQDVVTTLALRADPMSAEDVLRLASRVRPTVALSSSFGAEDMVLIDMIMKIDPKARIFTLDTGRLPQETYNVIDATVKGTAPRLKCSFRSPTPCRPWWKRTG